MTTTDRPTRRVTREKYRFTLSGPIPSETGRAIVITLHGPYLYLREQGTSEKKAKRILAADVMNMLMLRG